METNSSILKFFKDAHELIEVCLNDTFKYLHTPEALARGLEFIKTEIHHVRCRAKLLEDTWEKNLPFECDEEKGVEWLYWARIFNGNRINSYIFGFMSEQNYGSSWYSEIEQVQNELLTEIDNLHNGLIYINNIMTDSPDFRFKIYYERRKEVYMKNFETHIPNEGAELFEEGYKMRMLKSAFMTVSVNADSHEEYLEKAEQKWKSMLDKDGNPDEIKIGKYIFQYRNKLLEEDLKSLFRYVRLLESIKEKQENAHAEEAEEIIVSDPDNIFKERYSRYPRTRVAVTLNKTLLRQYIADYCLNLIEEEQYWFCLWKVLKELGLFTNKVTNEKFVNLMNDWFPDHHSPCTGSGIHVYRPSHLGKALISDWNKEKYEEDIINKNRQKAKADKFEIFKEVCLKMKDALTPFCESPNKGLT